MSNTLRLARVAASEARVTNGIGTSEARVTTGIGTSEVRVTTRIGTSEVNKGFEHRKLTKGIIGTRASFDAAVYT
jgi:hypothetical protein